MFLLNRPLSACEALECGLISEVVPTGDVENEALAIARRLAQHSQTAIREFRELLRESWHTSLSATSAASNARWLISGIRRMPAEGILAFVNRRAARFAGAE